MASPTHPDIDSYSALLKKSPLLGVLGILAFLNGFLVSLPPACGSAAMPWAFCHPRMGLL